MAEAETAPVRMVLPPDGRQTRIDFFGESTASRSGVESSYVQWDEATNSVIVTAPQLLMEKIKGVIAKLDIRRPQVLIQAVIAELVSDRGREL